MNDETLKLIDHYDKLIRERLYDIEQWLHHLDDRLRDFENAEVNYLEKRFDHRDQHPQLAAGDCPY